MSVVGFDFGNLSLLVAQTSKGGVDVILNDASSRQTATCVSIQGKQRHLGDSGANIARSNIKNTVKCMKLLVGRKFDDPEVQVELKRANFKASAMASGGVGINVMYNDEEIVVPTEHILAMMLVKGKEIVNGANGSGGLADAVLAVPASFDDAQRRGIMNACAIASVNCLKIVNESTAIALSYGIFKSAKGQFSETEKTYVMFLDMGYTMLTVCVVEFLQGHMKVLSTVCEPNLGGRDYDNEVVAYLCEAFQTKTKIDVKENKKAIFKLQVAAEKAKKFISPAGVTEAPVNVECLAEDMDLNCVLTKEEFEKRSQHLTDRITGVVTSALEESGLSAEAIHEVEVVGGATRVDIVKKTLAAACKLDSAEMNYGLKTTMNADEPVARGAALQCAMLSSRMKVKAFNILDRMHYGVIASYESTPAETSEDGKEGEKSTQAQLYCRGDELPHKPRRLTFKKKTADFSIGLSYDDTYKGDNKVVASYIIKVPAGSPPQDVRVTFNVDKSGCVYVQSAEMLSEIPAETEEAAEGDKSPKQDTAPEAKEDETAATAAAAGKEGEEGKAGEEKKEDKAGGTPKKRFRKTELEVEESLFGMSGDDVKAGIELEATMAFEDRLIIETAEKRNELETYIFSMRDKLDRELKEFAQPSEMDTMKSMLMSAEEWLYDNFDTTKIKYQGKLDELYKVSGVMEKRLREDTERPAAVEYLKKQIEMCRDFAKNYEEKLAHITEDERDKIRGAVTTTEAWMHDMLNKQGELAKNADPVLTLDLISEQRKGLFNLSNPIMTKRAPPPPKPAPAPAPADAPEPPKPDETKASEGETPMDTDPTAEGGDGAGGEAPAAEEAKTDAGDMDTSV